ncbi:hypothetical protein [Streptomyces sp. 142MFCol3.1]|nr:hypothetical protein [Streptomyces sp. 142MFCol3.1]
MVPAQEDGTALEVDFGMGLLQHHEGLSLDRPALVLPLRTWDR